jgi:hypothetical protein
MSAPGSSAANDKGENNATVADWLTAHDLTSDTCQRLLKAGCEALSLQSSPKPPRFDAPVTTPPGHLWKTCGQILSDHLPGLQTEIATVLSEVRVTFAPPPFRYRRAFTLHDDGRGTPYVYMPWRGVLADVPVLSHEFGHAVQVLASAGRDLPPAMREACALVAEDRICHALANDPLSQVDPALQQLAVLVQARAHHFLHVEANALRDVLRTSDAQMNYRWNYPIAQAFVTLVAQSDEADMVKSLFRGQFEISKVIS